MKIKPTKIDHIDHRELFVQDLPRKKGGFLMLGVWVLHMVLSQLFGNIYIYVFVSHATNPFDYY